MQRDRSGREQISKGEGMNNENISLYFKEGSSDKVYNASLEAAADGWIVTYAHGRRGSALMSGRKTAAPVTYEKAKKIYDTLVAEKTGKGYTPKEGGPVFSGTSSEARDTGIRLQLLNEIDESEIRKYLTDDAWCAQEKFDGRRRALVRDGKDSYGTNRKGLSVSLTVQVAADLSACQDFILDTEDMGDTIYVFDILKSLTDDLRSLPYRIRLDYLEAVFKLERFKYLKLVETAFTTKEKLALFSKLKAHDAEGIIFKRLDAPYTAGRPNSDGSQLKFKFKATGSFIVTKVTTGKRSVSLELADGVDIGRVTIPANYDIPQPRAIVEIEYLYAFPGGSLFQPVYLGERDDIDASACTAKQLKLKPETDEDA